MPSHREKDRMLADADAAERMQPWRCATCGVAVRRGRNDPCHCTRKLEVDYRDSVQLRPSLAEIAAAQRDRRISCPACAGTQVSDNGEGRLADLTLCCDDCGEHFDADALAWVKS